MAKNETATAPAVETTTPDTTAATATTPEATEKKTRNRPSQDDKIKAALGADLSDADKAEEAVPVIRAAIKDVTRTMNEAHAKFNEAAKQRDELIAKRTEAYKILAGADDDATATEE